MRSRWSHGSLALSIAGLYLLLVIAVVVGVVLDATFVEHPDASMAGVLVYAVTLPLSIGAIMLVPESGPWSDVAFFAVPLGCGILQAAGLYLALRGRRIPSGDRGGPPHPAAG